MVCAPRRVRLALHNLMKHGRVGCVRRVERLGRVDRVGRVGRGTAWTGGACRAGGAVWGAGLRDGSVSGAGGRLAGWLIR